MTMSMSIERAASVSDVPDVLDRILEKGIVIDAWMRTSVVGIDLLNIDTHMIVASLDTYLSYSDAQGTALPASTRASALPRQPSRVARDLGLVHIIREVFGAWNAHDVERYVALLDRGYVGETHAVPTPLRGRKPAGQTMQWYLATFPDLRFELEDMVSTGDDVLASWLFTGTLQSHASSHWPDRQLKVHGCTVSRIKHGKVLYAWNYWDTIIMTGRPECPTDGAYAGSRVAAAS